MSLILQKYSEDKKLIFIYFWTEYTFPHSYQTSKPSF